MPGEKALLGIPDRFKSGSNAFLSPSLLSAKAERREGSIDELVFHSRLRPGLLPISKSTGSICGDVAVKTNKEKPNNARISLGGQRTVGGTVTLVKRSPRLKNNDATRMLSSWLRGHTVTYSHTFGPVETVTDEEQAARQAQR